MFKEKLKELRLEKNITQKEMSKMLNISITGYASWEQGKSQPSIEYIRMLSNILDVSPNELIGEDSYEYNFEYNGNGVMLTHKERKQKTQNDKDTTNTVRLMGRNGEADTITLSDTDMQLVRDIIKKIKK